MAVLLALLGALVLAGCVGWVDDAPDDSVWVDRNGAPPAQDLKSYTELVHVGADVGKQSTRLVARVLTTAPAPIDVTFVWTTTGGSTGDHLVILDWFDRALTWNAYAAATDGPPTLQCTGNGNFNGGEYSVTLATSCLGNTTGLAVSASAAGRNIGTTPGWYDDSARTQVIGAS